MNTNLFAIDVGNTRSHFGVFASDQLLDTAVVNNHELDSQLPDVLAALAGHMADLEPVACYLASVNEPIARTITARFADRFGRQPMRVELDMPVPIGRQLDSESIVGADRLLNAAAVYHKIKQACIVVDAGTAVTVDFVDGDGVFHGGAILPGVHLMMQSMSGNTHLLPEIGFARPDEPIGHSTVQAMRTGVFHGLRGAVRELTEIYAQAYGAYPTIVATGGDAALLFDGYELIETVIPNLTLYGIHTMHRLLSEQQDRH